MSASSPRLVLVPADPEAAERSLAMGHREVVRDVFARLRLPHRSVCQGSAICGTCWVEVLTEDLPPPAPDEQTLLDRFAAGAHNPRLACRLAPTAEQPVLRIRPPRPPPAR